jgi:hypothetical protein
MEKIISLLKFMRNAHHNYLTEKKVSSVITLMNPEIGYNMGKLLDY